MSEESQSSQENISAEKILLIDLENCPDQIHQLQKSLEEFSQVVICYARTGAKIPLDWLVPLSATVSANKLKIFKMANGGKNAADFGLCFFAGALMQQLSPETHFVIISNDTDLDHVVSLLQSQGRTAERVGSQKTQVQAEEQKPLATATESSSQKTNKLSSIKIYCMHLMTYSKNRPAKQDTLLNSIRNKFKDDPEEAVKVFHTLKSQGAIKIVEKKVSYDDKKIQALAQ